MSLIPARIWIGRGHLQFTFGERFYISTYKFILRHINYNETNVRLPRYIFSSVSTIADVITKYETAFENEEAYARRPSPPYNEEVTTASGRHIHDICYNLLKLYCFKTHPLEQILNPATYSSDPLDYRLRYADNCYLLFRNLIEYVDN